MANKYEYHKRSIAKRRKWLQAIKEGQPCADCGLNFPHFCLDWHHLDSKTKKFNVGQGLTRYSREKLLAEIQKCVLVCANCHRIRHYSVDSGTEKC